MSLQYISLFIKSQDELPKGFALQQICLQKFCPNISAFIFSAIKLKFDFAKRLLVLLKQVENVLQKWDLRCRFWHRA